MDIILTDKPKSHMHTISLELGRSDFFKMSLTVFKFQVSRLKPRKISYRSYKNFNLENFLIDLNDKFVIDFFNRNPQNSDLLYNSSVDILTITLNKHGQ